MKAFVCAMCVLQLVGVVFTESWAFRAAHAAVLLWGISALVFGC